MPRRGGKELIDKTLCQGLVELTRMNCSFCSISFSATKAVTKTGKALTRASLMAARRCCPSTTQPGISAGSSGQGMTMVPHRESTSRFWSAMPRNAPLVKRNDDGVRYEGIG